MIAERERKNLREFRRCLSFLIVLYLDDVRYGHVEDLGQDDEVVHRRDVLTPLPAEDGLRIGEPQEFLKLLYRHVVGFAQVVDFSSCGLAVDGVGSEFVIHRYLLCIIFESQSVFPKRIKKQMVRCGETYAVLSLLRNNYYAIEFRVLQGLSLKKQQRPNSN